MESSRIRRGILILISIIGLFLFIGGCSSSTTQSTKENVNNDKKTNNESAKNNTKNNSDQTKEKERLPLQKSSESIFYGGDSYSVNVYKNTAGHVVYQVGDLLYVYQFGAGYDNKKAYLSVGKNNQWNVKEKELNLKNPYPINNQVTGNLINDDDTQTIYVIGPNGEITKVIKEVPNYTYKGINSTKGYAYLVENRNNSNDKFIFYPETGEKIPFKGEHEYIYQGYYDVQHHRFFYIANNAQDDFKALNTVSGQKLYDNNGQEIHLTDGSYGNLTMDTLGNIYCVETQGSNESLIKIDNNLKVLARVGVESYGIGLTSHSILIPAVSGNNVQVFVENATYKDKPAIITFNVNK